MGLDLWSSVSFQNKTPLGKGWTEQKEGVAGVVIYRNLFGPLEKASLASYHVFGKM